MACNIPTAFPSDCITEVLGALKGGTLKSGKTLAAALQVGSYFASLLPDSVGVSDDGVLKMEAEPTTDDVVAFLEVAQAQHESGAAAAFDPTSILKYLALLQQIIDILKGLRK